MEWTSVEDQLPEPGQEILGLNLEIDIWIVSFLTQHHDGGRWFFESSESGCELTGSFAPTHWMPLPEPPDQNGQ